MSNPHVNMLYIDKPLGIGSIMILLIKRKNAVLILLILFLSIAIFSLDNNSDQLAQASTNFKATVIVDAGHGGEDPGAVSDFSGMAEKDLNLRIAMMVKAYLELDGYQVIMTRTEDILQYKQGTSNITDKRRQDLQTRRALIDASNADIVVSIHLNKFPEGKYYGAQAFFPPESSDSERLAKTLQEALKQQVDPSNKRVALVKKERIVLFKNLKVPTALIECGFLSNQTDEANLRQVDYQDKIAKAVKSGIDAYFGN